MDPLDTARALLPWWAVWGPMLFTVPGSFLLAFLLTRLALAWPMWVWSLKEMLPWPERARWAYPVGLVMQSAPVLLALAFGFAAWLAMSRLLSYWLLVGLVATMALLGSSLASHLAQRRLLPGRVVFTDWPRSLLLFVLVNGWLAVTGVIVAVMPRTMDARAWMLLGVGALGIVFFTAGGGVWLAQWCGLLHAAPERLRDIVARTAAARARPMPTMFTLQTPGVNAFALPLLGWLLFTREADTAFPDEELEAITAHELAHLAEPPIVLLGRLAPSLALVPLLAWRPVEHSFGPWGVLVIVSAFFLVAWLAGRLGRHLERVADAAGKGHEASEGLYARALEKVYEANLAPAVSPGKGQTHPHLYDRLVAAGMTPTYERPRPPSRWRGIVPLGLTLTAFLSAAVLSALDDGSDWRMAIYGPSSSDLRRLADRADERGDFATADTLDEAAALAKGPLR